MIYSKYISSIYSSAILSRDVENEINMDDYVVIENVPDIVTDEFVDQVDGTVAKKIQPECFFQKKVDTLQKPKENVQYVKFNEYEIDNNINGKPYRNGNLSESSSETSSSDSISFQRIVLTPIEENEVKLSNGYDN